MAKSDDYERVIRTLTPKKQQIIHILYEKGELSQKSLSDATGSTVTAMSNLLTRMTGSDPPLIGYRREGKYRLYSLTNTGKAYMQASNDTRSDDGKDTSPSARVENALGLLKSRHEDSWETVLDDSLIYREKAMGDPLGSEDELLISSVIAELEQIVIEDDEDTLSALLDMFPSAILRNRLVNIMDLFEPCVPLIRAIGQSKKYRESCLAMRRKLLDPNTEGMCKKLRDNLRHLDEDALYRYFELLLPEYEDIAIHLADWILISRRS